MDCVVCLAPLSMEFYRQEYWTGLPCPSPGDLPDTGIEPASLMSLALAGRFFTTGATWEASLASTKRACILLKNRHAACMGRQIQVSKCNCISQVPCPDLNSLSFQFSSIQSLSHVRLQPHELQHTRPPCPSPTPGVHPDSRPLSQ